MKKELKEKENQYSISNISPKNQQLPSQKETQQEWVFR